MKFSIIIPCYNGELYIKECLDSIFNQTISKEEYEVIVINDGSNDKSEEIIKNYPVTLLHTNRRKAGGARNRGIEVAKGEYILYVDSDDRIYSKDCLQKLYEFIKDEDVIYLPLVTVNRETGEPEVRKEDPRISKGEMIESTGLIGPAYRCLKRETFGNIFFSEDVYYEDVLYAIKVMCRANTFAYFEELFYNYRRNPNSMSRSEFTTEKKIDMLSETIKMLKLIQEYPEYSQNIAKRIKRINIEQRLDSIYKDLKKYT